MTPPLNELPEPPDSTPGPLRQLGFAQLRDFLARHLLILVGLPLIAVATTVAASRLVPKRYEAPTTWVVSQLDSESRIEGNPLSIRSLRWNLESLRALRAAEERIAAHSGGEEIELEIGGNFETATLLRRRTRHEFARFGELQLEERRHQLAEESLRREFGLLDDQLGRDLQQALHYRDSVAKRHCGALLSLQAQGGGVPIQTAAEAVVPRTPMSLNLLRCSAFALGVVRDLG